MRLISIIAVFVWYVVTFGGQKVAGPFNNYGDCEQTAKHMAETYKNVSPKCHAFSQ